LRKRENGKLLRENKCKEKWKGRGIWEERQEKERGRLWKQTSPKEDVLNLCPKVYLFYFS
jgi:hypothetical protein